MLEYQVLLNSERRLHPAELFVFCMSLSISYRMVLIKGGDFK